MPDGNMKLVLAAEIPSLQNGGLAADGMSVTWKLKPGVKWHDGKPFTADDVVFNWEYSRDPATATVTIGVYRDITVEKVDDLTVKITSRSRRRSGPMPLSAPPTASSRNICSRNIKAPSPARLRTTSPRSAPVPTNSSSSSRAMSSAASSLPTTTCRTVPTSTRIEMKGGGDAVSAARAVIQTGEYDFGWNIQVEDDVLLRLEKGGKGKTVYAVGGDTEFIALNFTDPNTEVDGERSSIKTKHPLLSDPAVRKALAMLVDREAIKKVIYGRAGRVTPNFLNGPEKFVSKNTNWEFSIEKASKVLEDAGWKAGADGIREKDGKKLKLLYQTAINGPRQKTQAIVKQACQKAGIDVELKSVVASVFFSSDVANPDTYAKFYADLEMFQIPMSQPDPALLCAAFIRASSRRRRTSGRASISRAGSTRITTRRSMRPRPKRIWSSVPSSTSRPTTS